MHIVRGNTWRFPIYIKLSYVVYVPLSPPQHTLMGSHRKLGINLRFQISVDCSVSRSLREDLFTTCMLYFSINELFQALGGRLEVPYIMPEKYLNAWGISSSGSRTKVTELWVQRIIDLHSIANKLPHAFTNH